MELRVMAYNIYEGAMSEALGDRTEVILSTIQAIEPHILVMPESNGFEARRHRKLFDLEQTLGMRGFMAPAPTGYHLSIFIRPDLAPLEFQPLAFPNANAGAALHVEFNGRRFWTIGVHFNPYNEPERIAEASRFLHSAYRSAIMLGDFNAVRPDDPGFDQVEETMQGYIKARMGVGNGAGQLLDMLTGAGYTDLYRTLNPEKAEGTQPTVVAASEGELPRRIDYVLATGDLAATATECHVINNYITQRASDHYPVTANFDV
ncbi:MAG: endonuclease/exonuclease/phosphatase family protein [Dehalococcoidia bacterium]